MSEKIIQQGAEAIISLNKDNQILKNRIKKSYRLPVIDEKLRKQRTKKEAKLLEKVASSINVPKIIRTDNNQKIIMQYIKGKKLSEHLDNLKNWKTVCKEIGRQIAKLHDSDIIHGDLTTSNMILAENKKVYFIDFGLSFHSHRIEDKAVDLHLLKQALEAKHFSKWQKLFSSVLRGYKSKDKEKIFKQLKTVESRGRYKKH